MAELRGLLVDFGGVLTTNVFASFERFCHAEGLAPETVREAFMGGSRELLHGLELGRIDEEEFEEELAERLGVEDHVGLVDRLFEGMEPDEAMLSAVQAAKDAGIRTGMVSNSWGAERYDQERLPRLFDAWVISGEEGVRKPDPEIYALGAERIGLAPEACVFVDDLPGNLKPARAMGMATVHHVDAEQTIAQLEKLLGVGLR